MEGEAQGKQTAGTTTVTPPEKMSRYVVQRAVQVEHPGEVVGVPDEGAIIGLWEDIGEVSVPVRSHRKSAVIAALQDFKIPESDHPSFYRAIEADIAEPIPVTVEQPPAPPARLKVGR